MQDKYQTLNRSFTRRIGKNLRGKDKTQIMSEIEKFKFKTLDIKKHPYEKLFLEIGYGDGSHITNLAVSNPKNLYIGSEVFLDGTNKLLKTIKEKNIKNILLWPDDVDLLMPELSDGILDGIYILFPDPWPKKKYHKKRLFNETRKETFKTKIKNNSFICFASDIMDYFESTLGILSQDNNFRVIDNDNFNTPHEGYLKTKYHNKAEEEGRAAKFLTATKK